MSTKIIVDYRRDDQRRYIYQPYWISSAECLALDIGSDETKIAIMFSFPAAKYGSSLILIHQIVTQIVEGFTAGTITFNVGFHTLLTDDVTTDGVATLVDVDKLHPTASITNATIGNYWAGAGDFVTAKAAAIEALASSVIAPLDAAVPAIGIDLTTDGTFTAGKARLHMLISEVPIVL